MTCKALWIVAWLLTGFHLCAGPASGQSADLPVPAWRAPEAGARAPRLDPADTVTLNFDGADLVEVIHVFARHLRFNFTVDADVRGAVTLFSGQPVQRGDLLPLFHEVLRIHGAVAVKRGDLYRITNVAKGAGIVRPGDRRGPGFAMRIAAVRFFSAVAMKQMLTPFLGEGGTILEHTSGNYLVIVDLPSNIRRLVEVMEMIDVEAFADTRMVLYPPRAAAAADLARELSATMRLYASIEAQQDAFAARFLPLPRINQLLIIAYSEAALRYVRHWLQRLDVAARTPRRRVFIRSVENVAAEALARVLNQLYAGRSGKTSKAPPRRSGRIEFPELAGDRGSAGAVSPSGQAAKRGGSPVAASGPEASLTLDPSTALPGPPATVAAPSRAATALPAKAGQGVRVVAEAGTNSLAILATEAQIVEIDEVLARLDVVPRQVLMEVLVAEVTLTDDFAFGVEYALSKGGFVPLAATGGDGDGAESASLGAGFQALDSGFTSIVAAGRDFRVFVNALMQDARVKVLSSPHLLAVDNRPARIRVGSEQPVATGMVVSQEAQATTTTIQFKNVGRMLTIVPRVNAAGLVNLRVRVEVSDVGERVTVGRQSFDAFNVRDAETTAVLQDGQTLVIGGIITDNRRKTRIGIPLLMELPVLGALFRTDLQRTDRTELVILITPRVIRAPEEGDHATERFLSRVRAVRHELERRWNPHPDEAAAPPPENLVE